jgi:hypothetical protein
MEQFRLKPFYLDLRTKRGVSDIDFKNQYSFELFTERREKKDSSTSRMALSALPQPASQSLTALHQSRLFRSSLKDRYSPVL